MMKLFSSLLLLSTAIATTTSNNNVVRRRLEDAEEEDVDYSWMSGYTLKYEQCFQSGGVDFVYFTLCPADAQCVSGCEGGTQYVSQLNYFIDAFTESQLGAEEYACEMARENCGEADGDDDANNANIANCYANYNAKNCDEEDGEGNFNLQEYLECNQFDDYYVGPYCAEDGASIFLGYFKEDTCSNMVDEGTFENTYGYTLDYADYSIVADSCASCKEHGEHQNDGDEEDEDDVLEQCEELYASASDWADVAEKYAGKVNVLNKSSATTKAIVSIVSLLGLFGVAGCCWFAFGKNKKEPLLNAE